MDAEWMRERLTKYLYLCEQLAVHMRASDRGWDDRCRAINDEATLEIPTISRIVKILDPSWAGTLLPPSYTNSDGERIVRQALGALRDRDEWVTRLAPDSPALPADQFHPTVWRSASTLWDTGEYKLAVQQAAVSLSAHIKARAGSPLSERKLVQQVFAAERAKPGQVRLHFPGDPADETWQSRQQGLHLLAQGAFAGIRNVAVHDEVVWSEHEALEHLAVLSVIARWSDQTERIDPTPAT